MWPFDHYNGPGDKEAYEREWPNLTFLYQDGLLARLRKEIPDPEQRLAAYRSLSVDGVINYVRLHDFERRRLIAMDRQFGFEIGDYILENFQSKRLFYTTNHPNGRIIAMLMQYLLKNLGIEQSLSAGRQSRPSEQAAGAGASKGRRRPSASNGQAKTPNTAMAASKSPGRPTSAATSITTADGQDQTEYSCGNPSPTQPPP